MNSVFVTATGTEIGKTHISCAYLARLASKGAQPTPIKPLMSGFDEDNLVQSDAGRLVVASGQDVTTQTIATCCMHRFEQPVAPNAAARHVGLQLDYEDLLAFVNARMLNANGPVLVEGAGGIMSPVTDHKLHVDLINDLAMPTFLVTANYLGAISHTLTAIDAMQRRSIPVLGVIVNQPDAQSSHPQGLVDELPRWTDLPLLSAVYGKPNELTSLADEMITLSGINLGV